MSKTVIAPLSRAILKDELKRVGKVRKTRKGDNEIYIVNFQNAPNLVQEIGRLRELSFRASGGGTGEEVDLDRFDLADPCYEQLIVWSPEDEEIIGGYRFIPCHRAIVDGEVLLSTAHYFDFNSNFLEKYLPYTIELGRSFVQPNFQPAINPKKGLFALDNIWDGLGAIIRHYPDIRYFFGKVTMYPTYNSDARDALLYFLHLYFPDRERLLEPYHPLLIDHSNRPYVTLFKKKDFKEDFKALNQFVRDKGEFIPPLVNIYMNLSETMKTFGTAVNKDFGDVEETGILVTIADIFPEKKERHLNYED